MPREMRAETASSKTFLRRPIMAMEAPCFPSWAEISKPIPEPPPVSRATLPLSISALNGDSISPAICIIASNPPAGKGDDRKRERAVKAPPAIQDSKQIP